MSEAPTDALTDAERQFVNSIPGLGSKRLIDITVRGICTTLVEHHSNEMFDVSRRCAQTYEKTSWLCELSLGQLKEILEGAEASLDVSFTHGIADCEAVEVLEKLGDLDTEDQFMVVFEVYAGELRKLWLSTAFCIDPEMDGEPVPFLNLTFNLTVSEDNLPRVSKLVCTNCLAVELGKKLMKCGGCHYVHYCSAACQKKHWPSHKPRCPLLLRIRPVSNRGD